MFEETREFRVLIVDDSKLNQHVLRETLKNSYTLQVASNIFEARLMLPAFKPHLILLDIILPDASGFDLLKELKADEETQHIPIIIITGLDSDENEETGLFLGAVDYIRKPFKNSIVKARVKTHIHLVNQMQTIERLGLIDALTELPNRRSFDNQSGYEWGRAMRGNDHIGLLMLDVDKFKTYNDTYGHPQGDVMLQAIAQQLRASLKRSVDMSFRFGGEEFAVLLPGTDVDGAFTVAERIRAAIEQMEVPIPDKGLITRATVSIGAASCIPQSCESFSDLVDEADRLLYQAKKNGRNRVQTK